MNTLQRKIMRRVYYTYALDTMLRPALMYGIALSVSLGVFVAQVHVASVYRNLLATELGSVPQFILNAVLRGEVLTLFALGVMIFTVFSTSWQLRTPLLRRARSVTL